MDNFDEMKVKKLAEISEAAQAVEAYSERSKSEILSEPRYGNSGESDDGASIDSALSDPFEDEDIRNLTDQMGFRDVFILLGVSNGGLDKK